MAGVRKRLEAAARERFRQSYETAALIPIAQNGKLKPMQSYLASNDAQTPREMLAVLGGLRAGGAAMTIKRVKRNV